MNACVELAGEPVVLRGDRSLYWPRRRTLLVADLHFGKADAFRAAAVPLPGGAADTLARLAKSLDETTAERLVVLGDFWHARDGRTPELVAELDGWRSSRPELRIELVRGNHDRAGPPPPGWGDVWAAAVAIDPPFVFAHHPDPSPDGYVLAGHLHPGFRVRGLAQQGLLLPCFWVRPTVAVLPAFGGFTGSAAVLAPAGDSIYVVADGEVIPWAV